MTRALAFVLLAAITMFGAHNSPPSANNSDQNQPVTFNKDVLPILQNNCQSCHRPNGVAPMSFMTYGTTRPWAKAIKAAVVNRQMPPWFADPHVGKFRNAPKITDADIDVLSRWADTGSREGNAADTPPAVRWADGWRIQPDVVVSMAEPYLVAAKGEGEVQEFFIPNPFREDTWVTSIEVRPGNPSVVHHVLMQVPEQIIRFKKAAADGTARPQVGSYSDIMARMRERMTGDGAFTTMEAVYAPGSPPLDFRFTGSAKLIRGGKPIRLEVHYTPNGNQTTDQTMVGFTLAKAAPQRSFVIMAPDHLVDTRKPIPAGESNWETTGVLTFKQDAELVWFMPHMHLRGKDMTFRIIYPDGREETPLRAKFNFNWQLAYEVEEPIKVPKGTRMIVTAHHDNSANNPMNPLPGEPARWGEMTSEEMMLPWFGVVVEGHAQPEMIARYSPGDLDGPFPGLPAQPSARNFAVTVRPAILQK